MSMPLGKEYYKQEEKRAAMSRYFLIAASGAALLTYLNGWGHKAECEEAQPKIWPVYRKSDL
jgi:sulfite oxidase